jgi:hypothetical protein
MGADGYHNDDGTWQDVKEVDLGPSVGTTVTVDGYSKVIECGDKGVLSLDLAAVTVDTSLDVTVQTSKDGTNFVTSGTFTQLTGVGGETKTFLVDRYARVHYNVEGDPATGVTCTGRLK